MLTNHNGRILKCAITNAAVCVSVFALLRWVFSGFSTSLEIPFGGILIGFVLYTAFMFVYLKVNNVCK